MAPLWLRGAVVWRGYVARLHGSSTGRYTSGLLHVFAIVPCLANAWGGRVSCKGGGKTHQMLLWRLTLSGILRIMNRDGA